MQNICVLGATGSVGAAALSIIAEHRHHYCARILVANRDVERMEQLCRQHRPQRAVLADETQATVLAQRLAGENIEVVGGAEAVLAAAADASCATVVGAIAGARGVAPAFAAAAAGKRLLLANKEALIVAGGLLLEAIDAGGGCLLPLDSEHCALFELLQADAEYQKLWLTASGGSVRALPLAELAQVTPQQALAHPNWSMGKKITIDSATMMNKALEIMEAAVLFRTTGERIGVVLHPQSTCHALVEYADGALIANWSQPDMRLPLARMLAWPQRLPAVVPPLPWQALSQASFAPPEAARYPCLPLAYSVLKLGGSAPAALSAANEVAVEAFLAGAIAFTDIARVNCNMVDYLHGQQTMASSIADIWQADEMARRFAREQIACWQ